jgi:hypothetical protein
MSEGRIEFLRKEIGVITRWGRRARDVTLILVNASMKIWHVEGTRVVGITAEERQLELRKTLEDFGFVHH